MAFEYKVIPAPRKGRRGRGVKGPAGRFAYAIEFAINEMAQDGWEFVRSETLGADEREGMMRRKSETFHGVLVFKRERQVETAETQSNATTKSEPTLKLTEPTSSEPAVSKPVTPPAEPKVAAPAPKKAVKKKPITEAVEAQEPEADK